LSSSQKRHLVGGGTVSVGLTKTDVCSRTSCDLSKPDLLVFVLLSSFPSALPSYGVMLSVREQADDFSASTEHALPQPSSIGPINISCCSQRLLPGDGSHDDAGCNCLSKNCFRIRYATGRTQNSNCGGIILAVYNHSSLTFHMLTFEPQPSTQLSRFIPSPLTDLTERLARHGSF
jgi:hypothetical protein